MNKGHRLLNMFKTIGSALTVGLSMSACATSTFTWQEEVPLHDGSIIVVERSMTRGGHGIAQKSLVTDANLTFTMPGTSQAITWADQFSEDLGSSNFNPMMLEIRKDSAYLVASPMGCLSYNKWGRPNPPYVIFRYQGKEWTRITLQELPSEFKVPNLVISSPDTEVKKTGLSLVPAEKIRQLNAGFRQLEFKTILREAVPTAAGGCSEMIHTNDGWEGLGFFKHQPSYEACLKYCDRKGVNQQNCPCNKLFRAGNNDNTN
jgi:hypothetical protein